MGIAQCRDASLVTREPEIALLDNDGSGSGSVGGQDQPGGENDGGYKKEEDRRG
jgi:hypothetical protein